MVETSFGLEVEFKTSKKGMWLDWNVKIPGKYKNQICGLCGKWDGNPENDFVLRDGTKLDIVSILYYK